MTLASMGEQGNFFEQLSAGEINDGRTIKDVKKLVDQKESFSLSYEAQGKNNHILTVIPLDGTEWLFIMDLSEEVFKEQSQRLIMMTTFMVSVVAVIFFILIRMSYRESLAAVKSKIEAQARSDFLSNMSHEIRTPLNGLVGLNHLMKVNIDDRKQLIGYIEKSANTAQYFSP